MQQQKVDKTEQQEAAEKGQVLPTVQLVFCILVVALVLIPFVGMTWARTDTTTENRELAAAPRLADEDGSVNVGYLSDWGTWFEDHFAYRNELVTLDALLYADVFGVSANDQVVVGTDGWLYYAGTLDDYVGAAPLSERELRCIAHNLSIMQTYATAYDTQFLFAVAPNKNSLYPEYMPSFYVASTEESNAQRLVPYLKEYGVNYADLFEPLEKGALDINQPLYLLRDSHWNNQGAYLVSTVLSEELGITPAPLGAWIEQADSLGDLDSMLFPGRQTFEWQYYSEGINDGPGLSGDTWSYVGELHDVEADLLQTQGSGKGSLVVYRDSFGNALLPYLAAQTEQAEFSKLVPYNALRIIDTDADYVIVERAERHLNFLARTAPIMPCPTVPLSTAEAKKDLAAQEQSTCEVGENGPLMSFSGLVDPRLIEDSSRIYVSVQQQGAEELVFEAFLLSDSQQGIDGGFLAYVPKAAFTSGEIVIKVFATQNDRLFLVQSLSHQVDER
jgi:hypothetical protein